MVLTMGDGPDVGVGTITWFIIILIIIFILLIILILVCLLKRNRGGKYPVQKKVGLFRTQMGKPHRLFILTVKSSGFIGARSWMRG